MLDVIFDTETYPSIFTLAAKRGDQRWLFEISWRRNDLQAMLDWLYVLRDQGCRMVGFNNVGFDYPVVHWIIENKSIATPEAIYNKAMSIIHSEEKFGHIIWESDRYVEQIDLYKIHHFDNKARATSLKALEFALRRNVDDLPYKPGTFLRWDQCDELIRYNHCDVDATESFYHQSKEQIAFREELTEQTGVSFMNHNDTKIGKDYFITELEKAGVPCFDSGAGGRRPLQTPRPNGIRLADVILPYIQFDRPEFQTVLETMRKTTIVNTKAGFTASCTIDGFRFDFGTGGLHGAEENAVFRASDTHMILDVDVTSYYPNLAIANRFFPAHLSDKFCDLYQQLFERRKQTKKGSSENGMLKLALNGVYGDSGNEYSPFFDPQYTMSITVNGQLLLCMLIEKLIAYPQVQLISANTDGVCLYFPRTARQYVDDVCDWWQRLTKLQLEDVEYTAVFSRDCNNYIAVKKDGIKRKGAYEYKVGWHQDHSALVVPKAAEAFLVHGVPLRSFIESHTDIHDFMIRGKAPRNCRMELVDMHGNVTVTQNTVRYYIAPSGYDLIKVMPPLKGGTEERRINQCAGWKVRLANRMEDCLVDEIDHDYYCERATKLVRMFR